jgi:site-specific DNA-methyltransferase (adenine-specific)
MAQALTPFYEDGTVTIYHGDALAVLPQLDELVDVVIADPPYSSGGRTSGERARATSTKYVSSDAKRKLPEFLGDSRDQRGHAHWSALWLSAARRITRPGGLCFVWTDWRQLAVTSDALQAGGWTWRGVVVWRKRPGRPVKGKFTLDVEYAVWGSNGDMPVHRAVYPSSVVEATPPRRRAHIAQKPESVYEHMFSIAPERSLVLDPFTGSGSALAAAAAAGHRAIGVELDAHYCEIASRRIAGVD